MVEVLISGAGPAGAAAAIVLARQGVRVLVVDRARFPRDKLCGDTLNPGALTRLEVLGLRPAIEAAGLPLTGMRLTGPGADLVADYPGGVTGRAIPRRDLDLALVEAAARAGAQVRDGVRVIGPLSGAWPGGGAVRGAILDVGGRRVRVPALVTIAADGRRSPLGLALGLVRQPATPRRWAIGAYFADVAGLTSRGEMHIRAGHYIGVAPLPGGLANVCLVTPRVEGLGAPAELLLARIAADPMLSGRFEAARPVTRIACLGPLAVDAVGAGVRGLLLAGDAAGFVDPMTGDGLRLAIEGGMLAAEVAWRQLEDPHLRGHVVLAERRRQAFGRKLLVNRWLRGLVTARAGICAGAVAARLAPAALRHLVGFAGDTHLAHPVTADLQRRVAP